MNLFLDRKVCIGAGECVLLEPTIFASDEEGLAIVIDDERLASLSQQRLLELEANCPSGAITVRNRGLR